RQHPLQRGQPALDRLVFLVKPQRTAAQRTQARQEAKHQVAVDARARQVHAAVKRVELAAPCRPIAQASAELAGQDRRDFVDAWLEVLDHLQDLALADSRFAADARDAAASRLEVGDA